MSSFLGTSEEQAKVAQSGDSSAGIPASEDASPTVKEAGIRTQIQSGMGRMHFYQSSYKTILRFAVSEAMIILLLVFMLFAVIQMHRPEDLYYIQSTDGELIQMDALKEPNLSVKALVSWSSQAATEVMTFGFNDYRRRFQESSRNFTPLGWESFYKGMERSKILNNVEENQQYIIAAPAGPAILVAQGFNKGRYEWQVQVPLVITYQAQAAISSEWMLITMTLVQLQQADGASGVGIERWISQ